jgi:hypothetical protein
MGDQGRKTGRRIGGVLLVTAVVVAAIGVEPAEGYRKWRSDSGGWCAGCHGDFNDGTSPKGTVFPFDSKHSMHRSSSEMNTDCAMCHYDGDGNNPDLDFSDSDGFGGSPGVGCMGCHGRDYGGTFGVMAVGLREVHRNSGVSSCGDSSCHSNDPDPLPENVLPPYYGSFGTRVWDPCNTSPFFGEDFSLDKDNNHGLDNDGDGFYDEDDPDCSVEFCDSDFDMNGVVDVADLTIMLANWGVCDGSCPGDANGDGTVDTADLVILLNEWGTCPD